MSNPNLCLISPKHTTKSTAVLELRERDKFRDADGGVAFRARPEARSQTGQISAGAAAVRRGSARARDGLTGSATSWRGSKFFLLRRVVERTGVRRGRPSFVRALFPNRSATPSPDRCDAEAHLTGKDEVVALHHVPHRALLKSNRGATPSPDRCRAEVHPVSSGKVAASRRASTTPGTTTPGGPPPRGSFLGKGRADAAVGEATGRAKRFKVQSYPTLKYFADRKMNSYKGAQNLDDLYDFATGSYRDLADEPIPPGPSAFDAKMKEFRQMFHDMTKDHPDLKYLLDDFDHIVEFRKNAAAILLFTVACVGFFFGVILTLLVGMGSAGKKAQKKKKKG